MKKSHRHDELSDRVCGAPGCHKLIKQRMVDTKDARLCYQHFCLKEFKRGHTVNTKARMKRITKGLPVKSFK
jgi:hypothetical protein